MALVYIPDEWTYHIAKKTVDVRQYVKEAVKEKMKTDELWQGS